MFGHPKLGKSVYDSKHQSRIDYIEKHTISVIAKRMYKPYDIDSVTLKCILDNYPFKFDLEKTKYKCLTTEIEEWLDKEIDKSNVVVHWNDTIYFRNSNDALLFKLVWM